MSDLISPEYLAMQRQMHESKRHYGRGSKKFAEALQNLTGTVLDYGAGKGTLGERVPYPVTEYDPAIPGKDSLPEPHDVVVCTDVLEHIEPDKLDAVLAHIASLARNDVFFVISTRPAKKVLPDGRNAHLIIEPWDWWRDKLSTWFLIGPSVIEEGEVQVWCKPV